MPGDWNLCVRFPASSPLHFPCVQALKSGKGDRGGGPRLPKMPQLQEFQFYDVKRLTELFEKEQNFELFKHGQTQREAALKTSVSHAP